jgi:hypothetical protein
MEKQQPQELQVKVPDNIRPGVYANITNVNITKSELVLNFIYANEADVPQGTVVSRVIVTREHARELVELLKDSISTADELNPKP